jgi:hypothetical protein
LWDVAAAVAGGVGVEDFVPGGDVFGDAEAVVVADDGGEVGDGEEGGAVGVVAEEGEDVVVGGVAGDPGEAGGVGVALPEGGFVAVDGVEVADEVADAAVVGFGGVGGVRGATSRGRGFRTIRRPGRIPGP